MKLFLQIRKTLIILFIILLSGCVAVGVYQLTTKNITGIVTINGEPVPGAKVIFNANSHWFGRWDEQTIITDEKGFFVIPEWTKFTSVVLPHQPVIEQVLTIEYKNHKYDGWQYTRMIYSDLGDPADGSFLKCDLAAPVTNYRIDNDISIEGVCIINHD